MSFTFFFLFRFGFVFHFLFFLFSSFLFVFSFDSISIKKKIYLKDAIWKGKRKKCLCPFVIKHTLTPWLMVQQTIIRLPIIKLIIHLSNSNRFVFSHHFDVENVYFEMWPRIHHIRHFSYTFQTHLLKETFSLFKGQCACIDDLTRKLKTKTSPKKWGKMFKKLVMELMHQESMIDIEMIVNFIETIFIIYVKCDVYDDDNKRMSTT